MQIRYPHGMNQTESKDMERNLLIELLEDGDKITGTELFGELSFTIDDEP